MLVVYFLAGVLLIVDQVSKSASFRTAVLTEVSKTSLFTQEREKF